jgi:hypothetical protein
MSSPAMVHTMASTGEASSSVCDWSAVRACTNVLAAVSMEGNEHCAGHGRQKHAVRSVNDFWTLMVGGLLEKGGVNSLVVKRWEGFMHSLLRGVQVLLQPCLIR